MTFAAPSEVYVKLSENLILGHLHRNREILVVCVFLNHHSEKKKPPCNNYERFVNFWSDVFSSLQSIEQFLSGHKTRPKYCLFRRHAE